MADDGPSSSVNERDVARPTLNLGVGSPSTRVGSEQSADAVIADLECGLEDQLDQLPSRSVPWALIIGVEGSHRYVQFLGRPDGSLVVETTSNAYLSPDQQLDDEAAGVLRDLGWKEPEPEGRLNWSVIVAGEEAVRHEARRAISTLRTAIGVDEDRRLFIDLMASPTGDTVRTTSPSDSGLVAGTEAAGDSPVAHHITISRSGGRIRVVEDGVLIWSEASVDGLIEAVSLVKDDPLLLVEGSSIVILLPPSDEKRLLEALCPDDRILDALVEEFGDQSYTDTSDEFRALDKGILINGVPWGWVPTRSPEWDYITPRLLPIGKTRTLASAGAWMSASMTGAVLTSGLRQVENSAYSWSDLDGERYWDVIYDVSDWDALLSDAIGSGFEVTLCPACENDDPSGWEVSVDVESCFADGVVGAALCNLWQPCEEHLGVPCTLIGVAGRDWKWSDTWVSEGLTTQNEVG